ncbi:hypothetical protein HPP92_001856 [Vanilla planifolia]|uniref:BZIP domain-containing protein n=1 Tax=Vanilla planifolia TaxID=51239 RepID=A0A835S0J1_VANPL|nr:hypothetical protein HPP92_001856 [Vanilla planifolia]
MQIESHYYACLDLPRDLSSLSSDGKETLNRRCIKGTDSFGSLVPLGTLPKGKPTTLIPFPSTQTKRPRSMADRTIVDPFSPLFDSSTDLEIHEAHLFSDDHSFLHGGFASDLEFDGVNWDISVDDLLLPEGPSELDLRDSVPSSSAASGNQSFNLSVRSPESGNSGDCSANAGKDLKVCWSIKRKKAREEGTANSTPNPRSNKFLRTEEISSCVINAGCEEEKKKARLMRNRESAQLSRQRKKHYVEELEEKVRSLHSTIAELNSKVSFIMAENASLKQQLVGNGSTTTKPGVYAAPITPLHFPWFPYPGVAFRSQGSPVPLVPIPKLKTQPPGKGGKLKKFDSKKGERRTKKVASFSLLGLLFSC